MKLHTQICLEALEKIKTDPTVETLKPHEAAAEEAEEAVGIVENLRDLLRKHLEEINEVEFKVVRNDHISGRQPLHALLIGYQANTQGLLILCNKLLSGE